jgi:DNA repair protein RadC
MINKNFNPFNDVVMESQKRHTTIKELSEADRPREKLLAKGASALTVPELLAVIVGSGTTEQTAVELMQDVMRDCENSLICLNRMTVEDLMQYKGIGEARALSIVAAAEIGRRRSEEKLTDIASLSDGKSVHEYMLPRIQDLDHEESWVLLLNNSMRLIRCVHLSRGGLTETAVDARQLLKHALLASATCFVLVHNHPSGNVRPSMADNELTRRVNKAAQTMNIRMIDHVIVTDGDYYSFAENGKIICNL